MSNKSYVIYECLEVAEVIQTCRYKCSFNQTIENLPFVLCLNDNKKDNTLALFNVRNRRKKHCQQPRLWAGFQSCNWAQKQMMIKILWSVLCCLLMQCTETHAAGITMAMEFQGLKVSRLSITQKSFVASRISLRNIKTLSSCFTSDFFHSFFHWAAKERHKSVNWLKDSIYAMNRAKTT